jgi:hypothetical protein
MMRLMPFFRLLSAERTDELIDEIRTIPAFGIFLIAFFFV